MIRAVLLGATGRMGQAVLRAALDSPDICISAAVAARRSAHLGRDAGELAGLRRMDLPITDSLGAALAQADVAIDFSQAAATEGHVAACRAAGKALLVGATGQTAAALRACELAASKIALLIAPNTSLGVALLIELVRSAASRLPPEFDVEIFEAHHRSKTDAPSGTALALGRAVAESRSEALTDGAVPGRGAAGARAPGEVGIAFVRAGDLVGEHTVMFAGPGEQVTLAHRATDRAIFARGALKAAAWLAGRAPGMYSMRDFFIDKTVA